MQGLMMDRPLLTTEILKHAVRNYRKTEIVTRTVEGPIHRYTIGDAARRIHQLANALTAMGVKAGDRVGVIGWNTYRQFELYYAVGGIGAVLHTINPRLGIENASFVINHAEDDYLFYDTTFAPLVAMMRPNLKTVKGYYVLTDTEHAGESGDGAAVSPAKPTVSTGRSSTRTAPSPCATPPAPRAIPRASSTAIARLSCNPSPPSCRRR